MQRRIITPKWVNGQTIYEVNLRQYTNEGTIKAFELHLPRLKDLGVGILWFMPIQPIGKKNRKGTLGSYYSICNYSEVNPEFGTLEDFKSLVRQCHKLGMKVIIDWVANHTAWDHHWTIEHPDFYSIDENGVFKPPVEDWEDVIHLNFENPDLWDEMIDQMSFWLKETDIDGFRCDMAHLVQTPFWNEARKRLDKIKPVYMLAESENHDLLDKAFDTIYAWKLLHEMNETAAGNKNANELINLAKNELDYLPNGASFMNFTSNHDENSWQGSAIERLHYFLEPLTILTFLLPGIPLIYSGQEAENFRRLQFFDKDEIDWKEDKMFELFKQLVDLKRNHPALRNDYKIQKVKTDAENSILALSAGNEKDKMVFLANLSDIETRFYIKCEDYGYAMNNILDKRNETVSCHEPINLSPYTYLLLENC